MLDHSQQPVTVLSALTDAYARGETARGESLFEQALDQELPWDQVCAAAASGVSRHYAVHHLEQPRA